MTFEQYLVSRSKNFNLAGTMQAYFETSVLNVPDEKERPKRVQLLNLSTLGTKTL